MARQWKPRRNQRDAAQGCGRRSTPCKAGTLGALRELLDASKLDIPAHLPPMSAGVFGYLSYDTVRLVEKLPSGKARSGGRARRVSHAARDHGHLRRRERRDDHRHHGAPSEARLGENGLFPRRGPARANPGRARHEKRPCSVRRWLRSARLRPQASNMAPEDYMAMVAKAKEYIAAGDIFQVVLSQRFSARFELPPFALYRALRRVNPSPFLYFLNFGGFAVAGSSPEILVRVRGGEVTIRPIAGTRPAGCHARGRQAPCCGAARPTRRNARSISCFSTLAATMWAASPKSARCA